jgi:hypothetical protein
MSKSNSAKVRSQQAYNAKKIGNKPGLPPRVGKSLHSFLLLNKVNANCGCKSYADNTIPTILSMVVDGNSNIVITFTELLHDNTLDATTFKVLIETGGVWDPLTKQVAADDNVTTATIVDGKLKLDVKAAVATNAKIKLYYDKNATSSTNNLKDKAGNEVVTIAGHEKQFVDGI